MFERSPVTPSAVRGRWRYIAAAVVLGLVLPQQVRASVDELEEHADQIAADILDTRQRANEAADRLFEAEADLDEINLELDDAAQQVASVESEVSELRTGLQESAIQQFVGGGVDSNPFLNNLDSANQNNVAHVMVGAATGTGLSSVDDFESALDELDAATQALEQKRAESETAQAAYEQSIETAEAELERLTVMEAEVQNDLEVQRALEAERQRRAAEAAAQAAAEQAAAEKAAAEKAAADKAAAEQAAAASASGSNQAQSESSGDSTESSGSDSGESSGDSSEQSTTTTTTEAATSSSSSSSSSSSGNSGSSGSSGASIVCPVAGTHSFSDTWGAARSGGRSHEGVDMISNRGVPLVAVESGEVVFKTNRLGGNAVRLYGDSGTSYYYAHLSSWEGSSRTVSKGEVIGYVGKTGNTSVNHLHFQVHPGNGQAVNPYPYVRAVC